MASGDIKGGKIPLEMWRRRLGVFLTHFSSFAACGFVWKPFRTFSMSNLCAPVIEAHMALVARYIPLSVVLSCFLFVFVLFLLLHTFLRTKRNRPFRESAGYFTSRSASQELVKTMWLWSLATFRCP